MELSFPMNVSRFSNHIISYPYTFSFLFFLFFFFLIEVHLLTYNNRGDYLSIVVCAN